jgi:hypothetical protein
MNKASGKLAAGVRKMKTQQKPPTDAAQPAPAVTPPRAAAVPPVGAQQALHPARVWPD